MRQVRLDDDVAALVEDYQNAEGLKSLSASANRMLRLAAGPEEQLEPAPVPDPPAKRVDPTVTVPRPRRRRQRLPGPSPDGRTFRTPTPERPPAAHPTVIDTRSSRCAHPILARRGDTCGACGATLPTSASTPDHPRR